MTGTKDKMKSIGKKGRIRFLNLFIDVEVVDYKNSYGRDRWLVTPVSGKGETWTEQNPTA